MHKKSRPCNKTFQTSQKTRLSGTSVKKTYQPWKPWCELVCNFVHDKHFPLDSTRSSSSEIQSTSSMPVFNKLDPRMTSNGFKWGCAQAILSSSISGVELTTTKVSWLLLPLTCIPTSRGKASISFGSLSRSTCTTRQGRGCSSRRGIYRILCKEVADKRGHLPAQATTTLAWCERPAWAG